MSRATDWDLPTRTSNPRSWLGHADPVRRVLRSIEPIDWLFAGCPLAVFGLLFATCLLAEADLAISGLFYCEQADCWPLKNVEPFAWCYRSGCTPAVLLGATAMTLGLLALVISPLRRVRKPALFLGLTLAIGPGVLVNAVLKPNVARPRPYQTIAFGGEERFAYVGAASSSGNHSFPSGHASMGYFWMTPALLLYRRRPGLAACVFLLGFSYGTLIGAARIAQGAHFASDVIGSALCVYATAVALLFVRACLKQAAHPADQAAGAAGPVLVVPPTPDPKPRPRRLAA